jgi:hypothetical protein
MGPDAVRIANQHLWAAHPEIGGRQLTMDPSDATLRVEWLKFYKEAATVSPPPPGVAPAPATPPPPAPVVVACAPPPAPVVAACAPPPSTVKTSDCKAIKNHLQEGDIVLRGERGDDESEFITKVSKCNFSHAGIVARDDKGALIVVDAYPGRGPDEETQKKESPTASNKNAVAANSIDSFFCNHGATQGLVTRLRDCDAAKKAAQWAFDQTKDPDYTFDLFDQWNKDPKRLYCADFVYQSFQNAGVDMVQYKMDFLDAANKQNTLSAARDFKWKARLASDTKLERELLSMTGGSSEYITPCQVASNPKTDAIVDFDASTPSGSSSGKKANRN